MLGFDGEEVTLISLNTRFEKLERLLLQRFPDTDNSEAETSATEGRVPNRRGNRRRRAREKRRQWTDDYASASEAPTEHPSDTADDDEGDGYYGMTREEEHHALNSHSLWEALGPIVRIIADYDGLSDAQAEAEVRNLQAVVSKYKAGRAGGGLGADRRGSATGYSGPDVSVPPWRKDRGQPKTEAQANNELDGDGDVEIIDAFSDEDDEAADKDQSNVTKCKIAGGRKTQGHGKTRKPVTRKAVGVFKHRERSTATPSATSAPHVMISADIAQLG